MSGRLLSFSQYLQSADNVKVIELFPRSQKNFTYDFGTDVSTYTFTADYQSLLVDEITYNRDSGEPNFTSSNMIGYFNNVTSVPGANINDGDASIGQVVLTIPEQRYTGPLLPNARDNVVMTVLSFQWDTGTTPVQKDSHRWAIIERWEPEVTVGDPILSNTFIAIGVGAISTFSSDVGTDANRTEGTYTVPGLPDASSEGTGNTFSIIVDSSGGTTVNITSRGTGFAPGDTIKILDSTLGAGGGADITVTVSTTA